MKEEVNSDLEVLMSLAFSKVYRAVERAGADITSIATELDLDMRECVVTQIVNSFKVAPWELPASMQEQLGSELKEAQREEMQDVL